MTQQKQIYRLLVWEKSNFSFTERPANIEFYFFVLQYTVETRNVGNPMQGKSSGKSDTEAVIKSWIFPRLKPRNVKTRNVGNPNQKVQ